MYLVIRALFIFPVVKTLYSAKLVINDNLRKEATIHFKFPKSFAECVDFEITGQSQLPIHIIQDVQNHCLDGFISLDHSSQWKGNLTTDEQNYVRSIFRKVISDAAETNRVKTRLKRDVRLFNRPVRREVREEPYQHWLDYARNVRRLKYDTISRTGRNKYDIIADIHRTAVNNAHFGPNFLPWHRLYLVVFESALGVPIPYWDSRMDFEMTNPTQSILWTHKYFGNGFGMVKTGPFANFNTPIGLLFRNIGSDGSLFSREGIDNVLRKSQLSQISEPTAMEESSLEGHHNGVHIWVDGLMNNLALSPHDPIFYTHHSFVDYVWEQFRRKQMKNGINPYTETVTPPDTVELQNRTDPAVGLTGYYNIDGYSKMIANLYTYSSRTQFPVCSSGPGMLCDNRKQAHVSRQRPPQEYEGQRNEAMSMAMDMGMMNNGPNAKPFDLYSRDMRVRMDSVTMDYESMSTGNGASMMNNDMNNDMNMHMEYANPMSRNGMRMRTTRRHKSSYEPYFERFESPRPITHRHHAY